MLGFFLITLLLATFCFLYYWVKVCRPGQTEPIDRRIAQQVLDADIVDNTDEPQLQENFYPAVRCYIDKRNSFQGFRMSENVDVMAGWKNFSSTVESYLAAMTSETIGITYQISYYPFYNAGTSSEIAEESATWAQCIDEKNDDHPQGAASPIMKNVLERMQKDCEAQNIALLITSDFFMGGELNSAQHGDDVSKAFSSLCSQYSGDRGCVIVIELELPYFGVKGSKNQYPDGNLQRPIYLLIVGADAEETVSFGSGLFCKLSQFSPKILWNNPRLSCHMELVKAENTSESAPLFVKSNLKEDNRFQDWAWPCFIPENQFESATLDFCFELDFDGTAQSDSTYSLYKAYLQYPIKYKPDIRIIWLGREQKNREIKISCTEKSQTEFLYSIALDGEEFNFTAKTTVKKNSDLPRICTVHLVLSSEMINAMACSPYLFCVQLYPEFEGKHEALQWAGNLKFDSWFDNDGNWLYDHSSYDEEVRNDSKSIICTGHNRSCWKEMKDINLPYKSYMKTTWLTRLLNFQNFGGFDNPIVPDEFPSVEFVLQGRELSRNPITQLVWAHDQ